jgi:hypothetical protein
MISTMSRQKPAWRALCASIALIFTTESTALAQNPISLRLRPDYDPSRTPTADEVRPVLLAAAANLEAAPNEAGRLQKVLGKQLVILFLSGEELGLQLSEIYGNARRVIEGNTPLNIAPLDLIGVEERTKWRRECAGKGDCFATRVKEAQPLAGLLLTVSAERLDEGYLLGFRLVDVETQKEIGAAGDEVPMGMSMLGAMEKQLPSVFPSWVWGQVSTLQVESVPAGAEVNIAGRSCVSPCELTRLPPGKYEVTLRKSGFIPYQGSVALNAKETSKISQTLKEPESSIFASPIFWGIVGAVVIAGGVLTYIAVRPTDRTVNICIAENPNLCT